MLVRVAAMELAEIFQEHQRVLVEYLVEAHQEAMVAHLLN
jgi:hypothetical protein